MLTNDSRPSRREVVALTGLGLGATVLAACSSSGDDSAATTASPAPGSGTPGAAPGTIAKTSDVQVGSGVVAGDVVVTQPTAGVFKGFSSVCTHSGCNVSEVTDGKIICPCHGSEFNLDGTVAKGPATTPLEPTSVSVRGDSIIAG